MRVHLKGLNSRRFKRADGTLVTYYYAWKGGPRLPGQPGSPEFIAAFNEAVSRKRQPPAGVLLSIMQGYQVSSDFNDLAPRTRADYVKQIRKIETEFADFPLAAVADRRTRGEFLAWRDRLALKSRRQADYAFVVLVRIFSWAEGRGLVAVNPLVKAGRLYRGSRADKIWTDDDEAAFNKVASAPLRLALLLALWTGQRQGDLLRLTWLQYDGERIRLQQGKTGVRVSIPVGAPLKAALDPLRCKAGRVLTTNEGEVWTPDGFRASWRKACIKAGIAGITFHDLRGTAVTRLAVAGGTEAEIATITGHSLRDVRTILDAHYLHRDPALGDSAIRKLEGRTQFPEKTPESAKTFHIKEEKS